MSKQQDEARKLLKILFPDYMEEVPLEKITDNQLHRGIRVDFWIPSVNLVVEIHGIQHFKASGFGMSKVDTMTQLSRQENRDCKLRDTCAKFDIKLLEIAYNEDVCIKRFLEYL
jgi:hypothetical protein